MQRSLQSTDLFCHVCSFLSLSDTVSLLGISKTCYAFNANTKFWQRILNSQTHSSRVFRNPKHRLFTITRGNLRRRIQKVKYHTIWTWQSRCFKLLKQLEMRDEERLRQKLKQTRQYLQDCKNVKKLEARFAVMQFVPNSRKRKRLSEVHV